MRRGDVVTYGSDGRLLLTAEGWARAEVLYADAQSAELTKLDNKLDMATRHRGAVVSELRRAGRAGRRLKDLGDATGLERGDVEMAVESAVRDGQVEQDGDHLRWVGG